MNDLQIFENSNFGKVRVIERDGKPWFVAKDVCECLGLTDISASCLRLDDDEKVVMSRSELPELFSVSSNAPTMTLISESGLYALIMRSNKPDAKVFRKWVTSEVLPSIRKTGAFATDDFIERTLNDPDWAISMLLHVKHEREQRELAEAQRDEAIRTKSWIGSRREATAMNTASQKSKECERLREQIGDAEHWKQVKAIRWLSKYFALSKGLYGAIAHKLKEICIEHGWERRDIPDTEYGTVKAYPIEAIDILHARIDADANMLGKYRLA